MRQRAIGSHCRILGSGRLCQTPPPSDAAQKDRRTLDRMLRVDLAGEMAAVRICKSQLFWLSPLDSSVAVVKEILEEETGHRKIIRSLVETHGAKETKLDPLFKVGAVAMGLATAMLGREAVMCCHEAVEETITAHYNDQLRELEAMPPTPATDELKTIVAKLRDDEQRHMELGIQHGARSAPVYPLLHHTIAAACKLGIGLASRK